MLCIMIMQTQGNEAYQVTQAQLKEQCTKNTCTMHVKILFSYICAHRFYAVLQDVIEKSFHPMKTQKMK